MNIRDVFQKLLLPQDKLNHYLYGQYIFLILFGIIGTYEAIFAVVIIAAAKEIVDALIGGEPDILDMLATIAGAIPCLILTFII